MSVYICTISVWDAGVGRDIFAHSRNGSQRDLGHYSCSVRRSTEELSKEIVLFHSVFCPNVAAGTVFG
jgi:predicted hotdog family 3-hydroxylacyl-ACP dehydratase